MTDRMTRHEEVERAARALLAKLDDVGEASIGVYAFASLHGAPYTGPTYSTEASDLRCALSRRDDEKAVAKVQPDVERLGLAKALAARVLQNLADSEPSEMGCGAMERLRGTEYESMFAIEGLLIEAEVHRVIADAIYDGEIVPLYTRPEGHDAGAGKCGTCGSEDPSWMKSGCNDDLKTHDHFHDTGGGAK